MVEQELLSHLTQVRLASDDAESRGLLFTGESGSTGMLGAFQILLQSSIGSGMLMLPYCCTCGVAMASGISAFFACLAALSHYFLIMAAKATRRYGYHELFEHCVHKRFTWVVNVLIFVVQYGVAVIVVTWVGRFMREVVSSDAPILACDTFWSFLVATLALFPLVLLRSLAGLKTASSIATLCVVLLIAHSCYSLAKRGLDAARVTFGADFGRWKVIITAASVNSLAYSCHMNDFAAMIRMRDPTVRRAVLVGVLAAAAACVLYTGFGVITYLDLGDALTAEAAIESYPPDQRTWFWTATTVGVNVFLGVSAPLVIWAARNALFALRGMLEPAAVSARLWAAVGGAMLWGTAALGSVGDNVTVMFDLVGGLFTPILVYFFPALFYLRSGAAGPTLMRCIAFLNIVVAVVIAVVCGCQAGEELIARLR